jgi:hypothetical protein
MFKNVKIWAMPLLIFWLFTVFVFITSKYVGNQVSFDTLKDFYISTSIGTGFVLMLWVILARYKKFNLSVQKRTVIFVCILTVAHIVALFGNLMAIFLV